VSTSAGVPGFRVSANSKGEVRRTVSVPGTGVYDTKKVGSAGRRSWSSESSDMEVTRAHVTYVDAADGSRDLREGQAGVATAKVVGLTDTIWNVAAFSGVQPMEYGGIHGIRDAILIPDTDHYAVVLVVLPEDNPAMFSRKEREAGEPKGLHLGRLAQADANKWADAFAGRSVRGVVYLEAKPGTNGTAQVRFRPDLLDDDDEQNGAADSALPAAGWFPDPSGEAGFLRWWDGSQWTEHRHQTEQ
jgi:hypothetical protein